MTGLTDSSGQELLPLERPSLDALKVYGDLAFLAFRSPRHQAMRLSLLRHHIEPPIALGQFRIFHIDAVPRAAIIWGFLSPEVERRMIEGAPLDPDDWHSGDRMWVIDMLAPYRGLTSGIVRWLMVPGNLTQTNFRYRRVSDANTTRRIVHIDFRHRQLARVHDVDSYLAAK
jgi:cytolysin-activating lysine-acyltransferase